MKTSMASMPKQIWNRNSTRREERLDSYQWRRERCTRAV